MRIECPACETSYIAERLKLKTGPKDKAIIICQVCKAELRVTFTEVEIEHLGERSWKRFWTRGPSTIELVVTPHIERKPV